MALKSIARLVVGAVWVFHGACSKLLDGVPRHREIVARVLGDDVATVATLGVGVGEVLLGFWVWSGRLPRCCAVVQTAALVSMNALEIARARDLLISPVGMVILNVLLLAAAWWSASPPGRAEALRDRFSR